MFYLLPSVVVQGTFIPPLMHTWHCTKSPPILSQWAIQNVNIFDVPNLWSITTLQTHVPLPGTPLSLWHMSGKIVTLLDGLYIYRYVPQLCVWSEVGSISHRHIYNMGSPLISSSVIWVHLRSCGWLSGYCSFLLYKQSNLRCVLWVILVITCLYASYCSCFNNCITLHVYQNNTVVSRKPHGSWFCTRGMQGRREPPFIDNWCTSKQ